MVAWLSRRSSGRILVALLALAAGVIVAGCGSSSSSSSGASGASGSAQSDAKGLSGKPVVFGTILPVNSPLYSLPDATKMVTVAEDAVNAAGGIHGRPMKVIACDDQDNPTMDTQCAQKIVNAGALAFLAENSFGQSGTWSVVDKSKVPMIGNSPSSPGDLTDSLSFPGTAGLCTDATVGGTVPPGTKRAVFITGPPPLGDPIYDCARRSAAAKGIPLSRVSAALTEVDFNPTILAAEKLHPDVIIIITQPQQTLQAINAEGQLGYKTPMLVGQGTWNQQVLQEAKKFNIPIYGNLVITQDPALAPGRAQLDAEVQKYGSSLGIQDPNADAATLVWIWIHQAAKIANAIPASQLSSQAIVNYLKSGATIDTGGLLYPFSFKTAGQIKQFPRLFYDYARPGKFDFATDKWVQTSPTWVNGFALLNGGG